MMSMLGKVTLGDAEPDTLQKEIEHFLASPDSSGWNIGDELDKRLGGV